MVKTETGWKFAHRVVAERKVGRQLKANEDVHHDDEDKRNNTPSNLFVLSRSAHAKLHSQRRARKCSA